MLGDVIIAEPKALIGFAGPRVIEQTIAREAARGLPARRVPAREGRDRHDRRPAPAARPDRLPRHAPDAPASRRRLDPQRLGHRDHRDHRATQQRGRAFLCVLCVLCGYSVRRPDGPRRLARHIERLHPQTIALGLDRVRAVLERLAIPKFCPIVTVGGTNGKGSTCAMLEAILGAAGYRVGCYTSPHLLRYNERVRIAGREADDAALVDGVRAGRGGTRRRARSPISSSARSPRGSRSRARGSTRSCSRSGSAGGSTR